MNTTRPWKTIVEELAKETDPKGILMLSEELDRALAAAEPQGALLRR